jgi:hypothetical protein
VSSLIVIGAVVGGASGFGGSLYSISKQNRNMIKAFKKNMKYAQLNYNHNQNELTKQQTQLYHQAVSELFSLSLNAYQNNAQVEAAMAETGYEGRNTKKMGQTLDAAVGRQKTAIKDEYENQYNQIRSQKDALYIQMVNSVEQARDQLKSQLIGGTQAFMQTLNATVQGAAMGAAAGGAAGALAGAGGGAAAGGASGAAAAGGVDAISGAAAGAGAGTATAGMTITPVATSSATTVASAGSGATSIWGSMGSAFGKGMQIYNAWSPLLNASNSMTRGYRYGGYFY